jgi:predicted nuclease with TOPRIM domain
VKCRSDVTKRRGTGNGSAMQDLELVAQEVSALDEKVSRLENRMADVLVRLAKVEKVNARLEEAALTMASGLAEVSGHWDAVYEAMRRN